MFTSFRAYHSSFQSYRWLVFWNTRERAEASLQIRENPTPFHLVWVPWDDSTACELPFGAVEGTICPSRRFAPHRPAKLLRAPDGVRLKAVLFPNR